MAELPAPGILTLATGRPMYVEMALDLALSLAAHGEPPPSLAVDPRLVDRARRYEGHFDRIVVVPDRLLFGRAATFSLAEVTPYERTLALDADCLALGPIEPWTRPWHKLDFGMLGAWHNADSTLVHHGRPIREWSRRFGLRRYFKASSAVFWFERDEGRRLLGAAAEAYRGAWRPGRWLGDELGFALVAERLDLPILPQPWPLLWEHDLPGLDLTRPPAPLFHAYTDVPEAVLDPLLETVMQRRRALGLPTGSERYWRIKATSARRAGWRVRLAQRWAELRDVRRGGWR
jgi:hypothetical protein